MELIDDRLFDFTYFSFDGIISVGLEFPIVEKLKYLKPPLTITEICQTIT